MNVIEENVLKSEISFQTIDNSKSKYTGQQKDNVILDLHISNIAGNLSFSIKCEPMVDNLLYSVI
jgi:hypothetical protein